MGMNGPFFENADPHGPYLWQEEPWDCHTIIARGECNVC